VKETCAPAEGKTALILSGGGANGAYEVGIVQALCSGKCKVTGYQPLDPDIITGTSIGAFNASVLVSRMMAEGHGAADYLEKVWINDIPRDDSTSHNHVFRYRGDPFEFLNLELPLRNPLLPFTSFAKDSLFFAQDWAKRASRFFDSGKKIESSLLKLVDVSTLIDNEPTRRLVARHIGVAEVLRSPKPLKVAATNWDTGNLQVFTNHLGPGSVEVQMDEHLVPLSVLASTAIPGVFPPVQIDGVYYVDGGAVMNTPLSPAIHAGAETIHLIYLDPDVRDIPVEALQSTIDIMSRTFSILLAMTMNRDVADASRINRGLAEMARVRSRALTAEEQSLVEHIEGILLGAPGRVLRPLLIHRYHPKDDLSGMLGMLNFDRNRVIGLIERGYKDGVEHDCNASGCLMRDGSIGTQGRIQYGVSNTGEN
jgi:NTE family protein